MGQSVVLYTPEGEAVTYRPLSARLPEFLAVYGPVQGYAVETAFHDSLSLKPGLSKLYEAILQAEHKPEEYGLPPLNSTGNTLICRALLRDRADRVVATATAAKVIQSYKDLEVLETAARQRLLAALGFGGEVLDTDETQDQADQDLVPCSAPAKVIPWVNAVSAAPVEAPASNQDAKLAAPHQDAGVSALNQDAEPVGTSTPPVSDQESKREDAALAALIRQIHQQVRLRGIEPPEIQNREQARRVLQQLLRRA